MRELISIVVFGFDPILLVIAIVLALLLRRTNYFAVLLVPALVVLASYLIARGVGALQPPAYIQSLKIIGVVWSSALITFLVVYLSRKNTKRKKKEFKLNQ